MKKIFTLFLGVLLLYSFQLNAAYLKNISKTLIQPDGTVIHCFASGDEFHNWLHDENNYTIIQGQDGYYYYAVKDGEKIIPSEYRVGKTYLKSTNIQPGVNISAEKWQEKRNAKLVESPLKSFKLKFKLKDDAPELIINQLCIYIRFNDDNEWTKDTSTYYNWLNDETSTAKSMINYYKEVSYGKVEVHSHFYPRSTTATVVSYQDTHNRGYFQPYNETTNPDGYDPDETDHSDPDHSAKREWDLLERAINYFNSNYTVPDGMDLDWDDDGVIDNIEFFVLGDAGAWNDLLWPHNWSIQDRTLYIDGIQLYGYNFQIEEITDQRRVGVLSHEMGHALGYPDLYQYSDESTYSPVGPWDIMDETNTVPQSFGAYTKFKYGGWIASIPEITTAGTYTLNPIGNAENNCYKIASPYSTTEYFVVEYRKKTGKFEIGLPGSGLLIYRINTDAGRGNSQGPPDEVYLYRPAGTLTLDGYIDNAYFSSVASRTAIDNTTDPTPFLSDGSLGGLYISEVGAPNETISFKVDFYPDALYPAFNTSDQSIFAWETIDFSDISIGSPEIWEWTFEGGNPATYNGQNPPSVQYNTPGTYDVHLKITKGEESQTTTKTDHITVTEVPGANPPRELTAEVTQANPSDVVLNWTEPENSATELTIEWDDGQNYGSGISLGTDPWKYTMLSHWEPSDLTPYDDWYITEISFFAFTPSAESGYSYALEVYTGSSMANKVVDQSFSETTISYGSWTTVELTTPLQIDASTDLWFGVYHDSGENAAGLLFGTDNGPAVVGKGDVVHDANGIDYLSDHGINKNWNVAATVRNTLEEQKYSQKIMSKLAEYKSMDGYNVYRDGVKVNSSVVTGTTYTDNSVSNGNYDYFVTAVYTAGESVASNVYNINVPWNVGIPKVDEIQELAIYPNPVKEYLIIELEDLNYEEFTFRIYDQLGKLVYSEELLPTSNRIEIPVNNLSNGAYTLLMYTTEKAYQGKFVVLK